MYSELWGLAVSKPLFYWKNNFDYLLQARGDVERKTLWDMTLCNSLFYVPEAILFCVKATNGLNLSFK